MCLRFYDDVVFIEGKEFVEVGFECFVKEGNEQSGLGGYVHCVHIYFTIEEWLCWLNIK